MVQQGLQVYLIPGQAAYRPGETVTALLQVLATSRQPAEGVELDEVEIECGGVERVDTSWVSADYRRGVPTIKSDKRRHDRSVFQTRLQAATQGDFSDASLRRFVVRLALPTWLPPTFRGTSARYSYYLQATVRYRSAGGEGSLGTALARLPVHIWPAKAEGLGPSPSWGVSPGSGDDLPVQLPADATIKCWEIGPGTAVPDAISHIMRMASAAEPRLATATSLGAGGAFAGGSLQRRRHDESVPSDLDDAASEISYDEGEGQGRQGGGGGGGPGLRRPISRQSTASEQERLLSSAQSLSLDGTPSLKSYALRVGDRPLVRVNLHPPAEGSLHPGATLAGTLEFPGAAGAAAAGGGPPLPRCMQVLILLETEESVEGRWRPSAKGGGGAMRRVYGEQQDLTADTSCSHFVFTLPPDAPASFQTPLLALRWVLRFQFVASTARPDRPGASPMQGTLDTLGWTMPLAVVAPPP